MKKPSLCVFVDGEPRPQGSKRLVRGNLIEANKNVKSWRNQIALEVRLLRTAIAGPVRVEASFFFPRPKFIDFFIDKR